MQRIKYILICLLACALLYIGEACKDKKVRPNDILKKEDFVNILCDIHISDAYTEYKGFQADSLIGTQKKNFKQILINYNTDSATFTKTYNFYLNNPDDFDLVYLEVVDRLSQMQADAGKK